MSLERLEARDVALMKRSHRQLVLRDWAERCFGAGHAQSVRQRAVRFLEEAVELFQAAAHEDGVDPATALDKALELVKYMFTRPPGDVMQELGGVGVTVLLLAEAYGVSAEVAEVREIERVLSKPPEHFTARNEEKNAAGFDMTGQAYPPPVQSPGLPPPPPPFEVADSYERDRLTVSEQIDAGVHVLPIDPEEHDRNTRFHDVPPAVEDEAA